MKKIGFIPLRKGSKGILYKNKLKLLGKPLFTWVLSSAFFSELDVVYIFTDDNYIIDFIKKEYGWTDKIQVLKRGKKNASDKASTEEAMKEFCEIIKYDFSIIILLQATSPLTNEKDINKAIHKLTNEGFDSVVSVVKTNRFIWDAQGNAKNYDIFNRPRRQNFKGLLVENGAIYCITKNAYLKSYNRIDGKIGLIKMQEETLIEIDTKSDWLIVENLLKEKLRKNDIPKRIDYLFLDVDGVFTDSRVSYDKSGELLKVFNMKDGMGLELIRQNNVKVVVITSENSEIVKRRMEKLKIGDVFLGAKDKYTIAKNYLINNGSSFKDIAYVGDDINDFALICSAAWSFSPNDAIEDIKQMSDIVLTKKSANGAIREVCEFIIKYNKRYD